MLCTALSRRRPAGQNIVYKIKQSSWCLTSTAEILTKPLHVLASSFLWCDCPWPTAIARASFPPLYKYSMSYKNTNYQLFYSPRGTATCILHVHKYTSMEWQPKHEVWKPRATSHVHICIHNIYIYTFMFAFIYLIKYMLTVYVCICVRSLWDLWHRTSYWNAFSPVFRASSCELHKLYDIHRKNEQIGQRWFFSLFSVCFVDVIFPMCKAASFM